MIKTLLRLLNRAERKRAGVLLMMIILMGLLDMVGVASIMPFLSVLGNPEMVKTNTILNEAFIIANNFGIDNAEQFLFVLGIFVFVILVVSIAFKAFVTYAQLRFSFMCEYSISRRLVEGYLNQPYSWFLNRHSADLEKSILSEVNHVVLNGLISMINLISHGTVVIAILFLLILVDPKLSIVVGLTLTSSYALIYIAIRAVVGFSGQVRYKANQERYKVINEAFGAFKEVKVGGLEQAYIDRFSNPAYAFAKHQSKAQIMAQLPRFCLEAIAFGGMLLMVLYLLIQKGSLASALPTIALFAFAGYKIMPALQATYNASTQLRYMGPGIDALYQDIKSLKRTNSSQVKETMSLTKAIKLKHIQYSYPNAPQAALQDLSLTIPARSMVGLVGATGSGKTTTVDLILGLLEPQKGSIEVDGHLITDLNLRSWQRSIGYVPQQIYLADDTVAANIAYGLNTNDIDHTAVERAARIANLHEFVSNELPQQYQTTVGERGVRLSGGQRQRIGIARALYHNPQVLILDEATSALDNSTEHNVMEAIKNLGREITIIIIAHRLSTVKTCDIIYFLDKGKLTSHGSFDEVFQSSKQFKMMAESIKT